MNVKFSFTPVSGNVKTGPIPVTMSERSTCPSNCSLRGSGCYAESGNVRLWWNKVTEANASANQFAAARGIDADGLFRRIERLEHGQLWRHNVAGDLVPDVENPDKISEEFLRGLVTANQGKRGFTYTHHRVIGDDSTAKHNRTMVKKANARGFTVNLSADNLSEADSLKALNIGPVVVILPHDTTAKTVKTPAGNTVTVCPAVQSDSITCQQCKACAVPERAGIIGFPAHGVSKRKASKVFMLAKG